MPMPRNDQISRDSFLRYKHFEKVVIGRGMEERLMNCRMGDFAF